MLLMENNNKKIINKIMYILIKFQKDDRDFKSSFCTYATNCTLPFQNHKETIKILKQVIFFYIYLVKSIF